MSPEVSGSVRAADISRPPVTDRGWAAHVRAASPARLGSARLLTRSSPLSSSDQLEVKAKGPLEEKHGPPREFSFSLRCFHRKSVLDS